MRYPDQDPDQVHALIRNTHQILEVFLTFFFFSFELILRFSCSNKSIWNISLCIFNLYGGQKRIKLLENVVRRIHNLKLSL